MKLLTCRYRDIVRTALATDHRLGLLPMEIDIIGLISNESDEKKISGMIIDIVTVAEVEFLPPIVKPEKIICVGLNYKDHTAESPAAAPSYPSLFARFPSSQVGHGVPVVAPSNSQQFDFEGELAVIIGKPAWRIAARDAMRYVAGYSCFAENSVRDFQGHARQVTAGKNFLASGAFGPWLTTIDEIPDARRLELIARLNGVEVQRASISSLIFSIEDLIEYISSFTRLLPGDVISTGTPAGVGALRKPPRWLQPGDVFEVDIAGVGLLSNPVKAELDAMA
jgi:2-keto-4-pentenoate hydratase/2-oxohepta-3-ene-1,7-dioic acid hydratase in catechol pathway